MENKGTEKLMTDRLVLRKFTPEDAEPMFYNWANDPSVTEFLTWLPHKDIQTSVKIIAEWIDNYSKNDFYQWAIELKEIGRPIGSISVVGINEVENAIEIGYCIGQKWWGKGLTAEAFKKVIEFFFNNVGADRVIARHAAENVRSGIVIKKCGLKYVDTFPNSCKTGKGVICDTVLYVKERQTSKNDKI